MPGQLSHIHSPPRSGGIRAQALAVLAHAELVTVLYRCTVTWCRSASVHCGAISARRARVAMSLALRELAVKLPPLG